MADEYNLHRFVAAQEDMFDRALSELTAGKKKSHWMWFIFPQLRGLGQSSTADYYGITSIDEARAYLSHPTLAPNLKICTQIMLRPSTASLNDILGFPDDKKFISSMTLFDIASGSADNPFKRALALWNHGTYDLRTVDCLRYASEFYPR